MAGRFDPARKEYMKKQGSWKRFCSRREQLQAIVKADPDSYGKDHVQKILDAEFPYQTDVDRQVGAAEASFSGKPVPIPKMTPDEFKQMEEFEKEGIPFTADQRDILKWIFEHMDSSDETILETAPSRGAISMLLRIRLDPDKNSDFYKGTWLKLLPSKSELDKEERLNDDGRDVLATIAKIAKQDSEAAVLQPRPKDVSSEPEVPLSPY